MHLHTYLRQRDAIILHFHFEFKQFKVMQPSILELGTIHNIF